MENKNLEILGVRIDVFSIKDINSLIIKHATSTYSKPIVIFKPYVEFLSLASRNDDILKLLNSSDYNVADSVAVQWAASYLYGKPNTHGNLLSAYYSLLFRMRSKSWANQIVPERMAGVDQTKPLLKLASVKNLKVGILGGPKDVELTKKQIQKRFPGIELSVWSGYYSRQEEPQLVKDIASKKLDLLFCAMGFPKQEEFIIRNKNNLNAKVIIGEGGSFDYDQLGGKIKRAPKWMRSSGLEWLWRLILQPKRFKRQLSIPSFISKVKNQKRFQK